MLTASLELNKLHAIARVAAIAAVSKPVLDTRFMAVGDLGSAFWEPIMFVGGWTS